MKINLKLCIISIVLIHTAGALPEPVLQPGEITAQPSELSPVKGLKLTEKSYPVTNGSTSAEPLGVWVAARLLGQNVAWAKNTMEGEGHLLPVEAIPESRNELYFTSSHSPRLMEYDLKNKTLVAIKKGIDNDLYEGIKHDGTHSAYKKLIKGETDLIYECRRPSPDEIKFMKEHNVELQITPIALDGFVFLRQKDNPVTSLTAEQVRDIYTPAEDKTGAIIDNWKKVGGPNTEINAYTRNRNSGSQETMKTLVMKNKELIGGRGMITMGMAGPYNKMFRDKKGIGFTFFYYQRHMAPMQIGFFLGRIPSTSTRIGEQKQESPIQIFAINGVEPTRETIADGSYQWRTKVYAVTRKNIDQDHPAARLREWLLTDEGQAVIAETGYVPFETESN